MFRNSLLMLSLLSMLFGICSIPIQAHPVENPSTVVQQATEDVKFIPMDYEEYVQGIAALRGTTVAQVKQELSKSAALEATVLSQNGYETKYGRWESYWAGTGSGYPVQSSHPFAICGGIYTRYYVDPSNWALRYFPQSPDQSFCYPTGSSVTSFSLNGLTSYRAFGNDKQMYFYANYYSAVYSESPSVGYREIKFDL